MNEENDLKSSLNQFPIHVVKNASDRSSLGLSKWHLIEFEWNMNAHKSGDHLLLTNLVQFICSEIRSIRGTQ